MPYADLIIRRTHREAARRAPERGVVREPSEQVRNADVAPAGYLRQQGRFVDQTGQSLLGLTTIGEMQT
jgi:hypothetical protein